MGFVKFVLPLIAIVGLVVCAVNLYHTSYVGVPHAVAGTPPDNVEPTTYPDVLLQLVLEVKVMAPAQLSLAGTGSVTQIEYPQVPPPGATVSV